MTKWLVTNGCYELRLGMAWRLVHNPVIDYEKRSSKVNYDEPLTKNKSLRGKHQAVYMLVRVLNNLLKRKKQVQSCRYFNSYQENPSTQRNIMRRISCPYA